MDLRIRLMSLYRLERFHRAISSRRWSGIYDAIIELQRALPDSDDSKVAELRKHLSQARSCAEDLAYSR